jgi:hypothetical protein
MHALSAPLGISVQLLASADHGLAQQGQYATLLAFGSLRRFALRVTTVGRGLRRKIGIPRHCTSPYRARRRHIAWVASRTTSPTRRTTPLHNRALMASTVSRPQRLRLAPGGARLGSSARRALQIPFPRLLGTSARGRGTPWRPRACLEHGRSTIPGMAQMSAQSVQEATRARLKGHFIHGHAFQVHTESSTKPLRVSSVMKAAGTHSMQIH